MTLRLHLLRGRSSEFLRTQKNSQIRALTPSRVWCPPSAHPISSFALPESNGELPLVDEGSSHVRTSGSKNR